MKVKFTAGVWVNETGELIEWNGHWATIRPDSAKHLELAIKFNEFEIV